MKKIICIILSLCIVISMATATYGYDISDKNNAIVYDNTGPEYSGTVLIAANTYYDTNYLAIETPGTLTSMLNANNINNIDPDDLIFDFNKAYSYSGEYIRIDKQLETYTSVNGSGDKTENPIGINSLFSQRSYKTGDTISLKSENEVSGKNIFEDIEMICLYEGTYCTVWGSHNYDNTIDINDSIARQIGREFDKKFPALRDAFGDYWYDADGDGKVAIMCYDIDFNKRDGESINAYIGGYFWMRDMLDENDNIKDIHFVSVTGEKPLYINGLDCIHIDTYPGMGGPGNYLGNVQNSYSTLMHEAQHMINFSYQVKNGGAGYCTYMETYLNEAFSMAAEHMLCGPESVSDRISLFNEMSSYYDSGFPLTLWLGYLENYSLSYLFGQYIRTQYGLKTGGDGSSIFKKILRTRSPLNQYDTLGIITKLLGVSADDLITNFYTALYLKNDTGPFGFAGESAFDAVRPYINQLQNNALLLNGGALYFYIAGDAESEGSVTPSGYGPDIRFMAIGNAPYLSDITGGRTDRTHGSFAFKSDEHGTVYYNIGFTRVTDKSFITSSTGMSQGINTFDIALDADAAVVSFYAEDSIGLETDIFYIDISEYTPPAVQDLWDTWYLWYAGLNNQSYTISAYAGEGGGITPEGQKQVQRGNSITYTITPGEGYIISDVAVDGISVGAVESYTFRSVSGPHMINALFEQATAPEALWENPFTDVFESDPYYESVEYVTVNGLFEGVSETEFAPDAVMTRAMFVTVLGRLAGIDPEDYKGSSFDDVEEDQWYTPYVEWAAQNGIVSGYDNENFGILDEITIEQAIAMLHRYSLAMGHDIKIEGSFVRFTDGDDVSDWAVGAMKWAIGNRIYTGDKDRLFPSEKATRALVAEMLYNYVKAAKKS